MAYPGYKALLDKSLTFVKRIYWDPEEADPEIDFEGDIDKYLAEIYAVGVNDDGSENTLLAHSGSPQVNPAYTDGSKGQCMTSIPKLYYKEYIDANGKMEAVVLRASPKSTFSLHEKFAYGSGRDRIYMGMYEAGYNNPYMTSVSGNAVNANVALATFRTRAAARGAGWHQLDFWTQHLWDMLVYAVRKNRDMKVDIPGYIGLSNWDNAYRRTTGRSDILTTRDGSVTWDPGTESSGTWSGGLDSDIAQAIEDTAHDWRAGFDPIIANRFMWVENFYGHIYKMNDGVVYVPSFDFDAVAETLADSGNDNMWNADWGKDLGAVYATPDPEKFSSDPTAIKDDYEKILVAPAIDGTAKYIKNVGRALIPVEHGGDSDTHFASYQYNYLSDTGRPYLRLVRAGGALSHGALAGVAFRHVARDLGYSHAADGSRLCYNAL